MTVEMTPVQSYECASRAVGHLKMCFYHLSKSETQDAIRDFQESEGGDSSQAINNPQAQDFPEAFSARDPGMTGPPCSPYPHHPTSHPRPVVAFNSGSLQGFV